MLGWNDIGYTSTDLSDATPHMTSMAQKGVIFTKYYAQPSCTPSRVTMMTSKFAYKNGFQNYELQFENSVGVSECLFFFSNFYAYYFFVSSPLSLSLSKGTVVEQAHARLLEGPQLFDAHVRQVEHRALQ